MSTSLSPWRDRAHYRKQLTPLITCYVMLATSKRSLRAFQISFLSISGVGCLSVCQSIRSFLTISRFPDRQHFWMTMAHHHHPTPFDHQSIETAKAAKQTSKPLADFVVSSVSYSKDGHLIYSWSNIRKHFAWKRKKNRLEGKNKWEDYKHPQLL